MIGVIISAIVLILGGLYFFLFDDFLQKNSLQVNSDQVGQLFADFADFSENWIEYDEVYSPVSFYFPADWDQVKIDMWWPDAYTKGTRWEYFF